MTSTQSKPEFEKVFTVTDYYDGPRQGIANYHGQPHFYDCLFRGADYSNLYRLTSVSHELFRLALEDWAIWKRWERAFHAAEVSVDSHPALPAEKDRHLQIQSLLDDQLKTDPESCIVRAGAFARDGAREAPPGVMVDLLVVWSEPQAESDCIWAD